MIATTVRWTGWLVVSVLMLGVGHVEAEIIDTFAVGPQTITANSSNANVARMLTGLDASHVLNGERSLTIQGQMSAGSIVAEVDTANGGTLSYVSNNPVYTNEFLGRLIVTHILGSRIETYDLSPYADQFYTIEVLSANLGSIGSEFDAMVSVSSPTGIQSQTINLVSSATPYTISVPMSSFSGVDLTQAYNLQLDLAGLSSTAHFALGEIRFVPEPGSFSLLVLGLAGMAAYGCLRRRNIGRR